MKSLLGYFLLGLLLVWTFWIYSGVRTWSETVGFSSRGFFTGLAVALVLDLPIYFFALAACAKGYLGTFRKPGIFSVVALMVVLCASIASELLILNDERSFVMEAQASKQFPFSRARMWPNKDCTLIYTPEKGVWATE
jgi:hypothetical protein